MRNLSRMHIVTLILVTIALVASACSTPAAPTATPQPQAGPTSAAADPTTAPSGPTEKPKIVYVFKWAATWDPPVREFMEKRAAELGVEYLYTGPQTSDVSKQVEMIESFVAADVDVLIVSSLGPAVCNAVDEAIDSGVKVLMADGDCPESKREHFFGSDNISLGRDAAKLFAKKAKEMGMTKIRCIVITGTPGAPNLQEREKGFKDGCIEEGLDIEFLPTIPCYEDAQKAIDGVESALRGDPTINAVYSCAWWPFNTEAANLPLLTERAKAGQCLAVSVDATQGAMNLVDAGTLYGVVAQNSGQNTLAPLEAAYQLYIQDPPVEYPEVCNHKNFIITKEGGDHANNEWGALEYKQKMWVDYDWDFTPLTPEKFK